MFLPPKFRVFVWSDVEFRLSGTGTQHYNLFNHFSPREIELTTDAFH